MELTRDATIMPPSLASASHSQLLFFSSEVFSLYLSLFSLMAAPPLLLLLTCLAAATSADETSRVLNLRNRPLLEDSIHFNPPLPKQSRKQNGATILEMRRQHGGENKSWEERTRDLLLSDEQRVRSFTTADSLPILSGVKLGTMNYVVTVELGAQKKTLIADTGSDLTWVQCLPCSYCYNQRDPLYNSSASASYHPVNCSAGECSGGAVCSGEQASCIYYVTYGDGSYTRGVLARERLQLGGAAAVEGFIFGCGRSNRGLFGGAAGILGLGRGSLSLARQSLQHFKGMFSYCLPSGGLDSAGELVLGAYGNSSQVEFTPLVSDEWSSPYYSVNLTGVEVGGAAISAAGRVLVDSGTIITRLARPVYKAVKEEFVRRFSGYPMARSFSILDTCFNLSGHEEVAFPTLKFKFEGGAEMEVDVEGMFYFSRRDASQVCLAIASLASEDQMSILGNYQQRNVRIVYDTEGEKLGFARETCRYNG